jgi:predicted nucleic acid-binding protein
MVLVDANVLLDIFTADPVWLEWSREALAKALLTGDTVINPVIYSEVSVAFRRPEELDAELTALGIRKAPLPYEAAFPAGRAFLAYRRRGGKRDSPLPDFFIGAHAQVEGRHLLTRDAARYHTYFPKAKLIAP